MLATLFLAAAKVEDVKAKNPILPEGKEILWASIAFVIVLSLLAWKAWPAVKAGLKARQDRIAGDLAKAEEARVEAESSLEDYRRQLAEARSEAAGIIEEARQDADRVRQERIAAIDDEIAQLRARAAEDIRLATERAMSDLSTRGRRAVDRAGREGGRAQPRPRHADRADRELHQPGREQLTVPESSRIEAYANALLEVARAEGHLAEVEDELFRFARTFEGNDELRMALSDRALPADRRVAVVQELLGEKALQTSMALASFVVSSGRAGEFAEIVDRFVELAAAERKQAIAEVRSAIPLDAGADRSSAGRAEPCNRQGRRSEGDRRSVGDGRHRRHHRRHRDRRLRPSSARATERADLTCLN